MAGPDSADEPKAPLESNTATKDHVPPSTTESSNSGAGREKHDEGGVREAVERETLAVEATGEKIDHEKHEERMSLQRTRSSVHNPSDEDMEYPKGVKLLTITIALCLAVLCVALDNTIIATAIPKITDDFKALNDMYALPFIPASSPAKKDQC